MTKHILPAQLQKGDYPVKVRHSQRVQFATRSAIWLVVENTLQEFLQAVFRTKGPAVHPAQPLQAGIMCPSYVVRANGPAIQTRFACAGMMATQSYGHANS